MGQEALVCNLHNLLVTHQVCDNSHSCGGVFLTNFRSALSGISRIMVFCIHCSLFNASGDIWSNTFSVFFAISRLGFSGILIRYFYRCKS